MNASQAIPFACYTYDETQQIAVPENVKQDLQTSEYTTHTSIHAENLHAVSQALFLPGRLFLQNVSKVIEPTPGEYKDHLIWRLTTRISSFTKAFFLALPAILLSPVALVMRAIDHRYRPAISLLVTAENQNDEQKLSLAQKPLHIRTHNLGFVPTFMSTVGDLRDPIERAHEVVASIAQDTQQQPDIICFQETFHEDAAQVLCEELKRIYPYIVHNVAPQIGGFNSGTMIASKYPIKEIEFERFGEMMGVEKLSPRGITKVRLETEEGNDFCLYSVHTVALIGEERANARVKQIEQIAAFMERDKQENPNINQVLVGDFNTSRVTAWGEDNNDQFERPVLKKFKENFDDLYRKDHHKVTGVRTEGTTSMFLDNDKKRLNRPDLVEPSGSWYLGPFANKGIVMRCKEAWERYRADIPDPSVAVDLEESTWGTKAWTETQPAKSARFDYVCLRKGDEALDGDVEIRRVITPHNKQSASTDHLPVDAIIRLRQPEAEVTEI